MPLTWRNVDAPRLDLRQYSDASQTFLGGFDRLAQLFNQRAEANFQRNVDSGLANVYSYNDPAALRQAIESGALLSDLGRGAMDPSVRRQILEGARGQAGALTAQALDTERLSESQARSRLGGDIAALQIAARQGNPEATQMLEQLRQQEGFGYVAGDASDRFISGMEGHLGDVRDTRDFNYRQSRDAVADDQWMRTFNQSERHHNQRLSSARSALEREQLSLQRGQEAAHGFAAHFARLNPNSEEARSQLLRDDSFREFQRNDPDAANLVLNQFDDLHQSYSGMSEVERMSNPVTARFVDATDKQMDAIRMGMETKRNELLSSDKESAAALRYRQNQQDYDATTMSDLESKSGLSQAQLRNILSTNNISPGVLSAAIDEFGNQGGTFTRNVTFIDRIAAGVGEANRSNRPKRLSSLLDQETSHLSEAMQRLNLEKRRAIVDATSGRQDRMDFGGETLQGARDYLGSVNQAFTNRGRGGSSGSSSEGSSSPEASSPEVARQAERERQEQARAVRQQLEQEVRNDPEIQQAQEVWASANGFTKSTISPAQREINRGLMQQENERAAEARREFLRGAIAPYQPLLDMNEAIGGAMLSPFTAVADRRRQLQGIGMTPLDELGSVEQPLQQTPQQTPRQALERDASQISMGPSAIIFSVFSFGDPERFASNIENLSVPERQSLIKEIRSEIPLVSTPERRDNLRRLLEIAESK